MTLILSIWFNPVSESKSKMISLLKKLKTLVSQFTTEHRIYDTVFTFRGQNIQQTIEKYLIDLESAQSIITSENDEVNAKDNSKLFKDILKNEAKYERALGVPKNERLAVSHLTHLYQQNHRSDSEHSQ